MSNVDRRWSQIERCSDQRTAGPHVAMSLVAQPADVQSVSVPAGGLGTGLEFSGLATLMNVTAISCHV